MGFFVHFTGSFECVRCKKVSDTWFQTKILRAEFDNSSHMYSVGDSKDLDGLDGYCPLHPWDKKSPLVVAVGDWDCDHCGLNWQWAKVVFEFRAPRPTMATIVELSTLQPFQVSNLDGIHYLESELAELSGLFGQGRQFNWPAGFANWDRSGLHVPLRPEPQSPGPGSKAQRLDAGFARDCQPAQDLLGGQLRITRMRGVQSGAAGVRGVQGIALQRRRPPQRSQCGHSEILTGLTRAGLRPGSNQL